MLLFSGICIAVIYQIVVTLLRGYK